MIRLATLAVSLAPLAAAQVGDCSAQMLVPQSSTGGLFFGSVAALGDFHFLGDRTFLLGSVLAAARPWLLAALLALSGTLAWLGLPRLGPRAA